MEINFYKRAKNVSDVENTNNVFHFRVEGVSREQLTDKTDAILIDSGYSVIVPDGYVGLLIPSAEVGASSLISSISPVVIFSGIKTPLFLSFKLTTNAAPAIPKPHNYEDKDTKESLGTVFASLVLVKQDDFTCNMLDDKDDTKEDITDATVTDSTDATNTTDATVVAEENEADPTASTEATNATV